jgi:hypothetical protein
VVVWVTVTTSEVGKTVTADGVGGTVKIGVVVE